LPGPGAGRKQEMHLGEAKDLAATVDKDLAATVDSSR
jgi:hypothetical protein